MLPLPCLSQVSVATVLPEERLLFTKLDMPGVYRCITRYGYMVRAPPTLRNTRTACAGDILYSLWKGRIKLFRRRIDCVSLVLLHG